MPPLAHRLRRDGGSRCPQTPLPRQGRIGRRQLGGELAERSRGCRGAAGGRLLGGGIELGGDGSIGPVCGEREMAGPLLEVWDRAGQRPVDGTAPRERGLLVADRGEKGVREAHPRVVELDHAFADSLGERVRDLLPVAVRCRDQVDGRPGKRGGLEENVHRFCRQPAQAAAEQLPQALRHAQGAPGRWPFVRPLELAAELEREERIARRRLEDPARAPAGSVRARVAA